MEYYSFKHTNSYEVLEEENLNLHWFQKSYIASGAVSADTYTIVIQDWPIFVYVARSRPALPNFDFKHKGS
jgi:hypothetical protein